MKMKSLQITAAAIFSTGAAHAAIFTTGPFDAPAFEYSSADGFEAEIHDETTDQGLEPSEHSFRINMQSTTVFQGNSYFWLPSNEAVADNNGVPYVGVGLEELTQSDWGTNGNGDIAVIFSGVNYSGPGTGNFVFWTSSPSEILHFDSSDGAGDVLNTTAGTHVHYNWGFSDPGTYEITFGIQGTHVTDGFQTGGATYTFEVVPEPSSALLVGIGSLALLRRKR